MLSSPRSVVRRVGALAVIALADEHGACEVSPCGHC